ncbi:MAG: type II secretion system F family protein [Bacilli bacterium]|nr:type II secretion system F family protein [Bacilli bacterium]
MFNRITSLLYRDKTIEKINKKIKLLGKNTKYDAITFMNIRVSTSILVFFMVLYLIDFGYILAPIITYLYYIFLPNLYFDPKIKERKKTLDYDAMYFFEILALSIQSGNNLINALKVTSQSIDSTLSLEFREVIREVNLGKTLEEALDDMKSRIPSDTVNNIILNIKESSLFGNNIIDTLYNQIDYIRDKIVLENRAYISKLPLKISIISVVFFIPLLLLLILGPVILNYFS